MTVIVHEITMNNLLSYCGLVDARISASEKDLPVQQTGSSNDITKFYLPQSFTILSRNLQTK